MSAQQTAGATPRQTVPRWRAYAAGISTFVCLFEAAVTREKHDLSKAAASVPSGTGPVADAISRAKSAAAAGTHATA